MEFSEKQEQILAFLDKNYLIKESRFITKYDDIHEWGSSIKHALSKIFSFDEEFCIMQLKYWSENNGLTEEEWGLAYGPHKLKTQWSVEMARDLQLLHGVSNAEEQIVEMLSAEISKEIDAEILRNLKGMIKTQDELLGVLRCIGYETTAVVYEPMTFKPKKGFISMNHNDIRNERNINSHWKDWIQSREQNKKTQ